MPDRSCRVCGCTDDQACDGGCVWVGPDLCSACYELMVNVPESLRERIDDMPYEEMLSRNRFAPIGDPLFADDTGRYFLKVMARKRSEVGQQAHVAASKAIGWGVG